MDTESYLISRRSLLVGSLAGAMTATLFTESAQAAGLTFSHILGRPTKNSIALSLISSGSVQAFVEFGNSKTRFTGKSEIKTLDPFTFTTSSPKADGWQWTLGKTQYDWLKGTLEQSAAKHKFVYIHHLLVGDAQSRGGVEIAKRNEWGGMNSDGTLGFEKNRSGWYKLVHDLLVEQKVSFVFKGHDHLYVKQELDEIIYQTLPQPSHPGDKVDLTQYGYSSGKSVGGSGFLRVTTSGATAKVDFVKFDGSIADSYEKKVS